MTTKTKQQELTQVERMALATWRPLERIRDIADLARSVRYAGYIFTTMTNETASTGGGQEERDEALGWLSWQMREDSEKLRQELEAFEINMLKQQKLSGGRVS